MIFEMTQAIMAESALWLGRGSHELALGACERAMDLAAPRNYRLLHADALVQRARIRLSLVEPEASRARDDAEAALDLARFCGYAWAQRDAHEVLAKAFQMLNLPEEQANHRDEADQWNRRLKPETKASEE